MDSFIFNKWIDNIQFAVSDYEDSAFVDLTKKKRKPGTCATKVFNDENADPGEDIDGKDEEGEEITLMQHPRNKLTNIIIIKRTPGLSLFFLASLLLPIYHHPFQVGNFSLPHAVIFWTHNQTGYQISKANIKLSSKRHFEERN